MEFTDSKTLEEDRTRFLNLRNKFLELRTKYDYVETGACVMLLNRIASKDISNYL